MRVLLFSLIGLAAAPAHASSIEAVATGDTHVVSVTEMPCGHCPPLVVKKSTSYVVPDIENGTERVEMKEINGEMRVLRTEAWLGGSPVLFVTKASEDVIKAAEAARLAKGEAAAVVIDPIPAAATASASITLTPGVDPVAKTASLSADSAADLAAATVEEAQSREIDLETYQLRLK